MDFKGIDPKNADSVCFVLETELENSNIIKKEITESDIDCATSYNFTDFDETYDIGGNHFLNVEMKPGDIEINPAKYLIQANDPKVGFVKLESENLNGVNYMNNNKNGLGLSENVSQIQKDLTDCYQITIPDLSTFESNNIKDQFAKAIALQNVILASKAHRSQNNFPPHVTQSHPPALQIPLTPQTQVPQQNILPIQEQITSYPCEFCNKKFLTEKILSDHKNSVHIAMKPYECDLCNKGFNHKKSLTRHKLYHTGEKSYFCEICTKGFIRKENLSRHLKTHIGEKIFCRICYKVFEDLNELEEHQKVHFEGKKYFCELCQKGFAHKRSLNRHKLYHSGEKSNICEICQKGFIRKENLTRHKRSHQEYTHTAQKSNECEEKVPDTNIVPHTTKTPYTYNEIKVDFNTHEKLFNPPHTPNKTHVFQISLKTYKNASTDTNQIEQTNYQLMNRNVSTSTDQLSLNTNQLQTHMADRSYNCHVCHKDYVKKVDYSTHQQPHTDRKLFTCDNCSKSYLKQNFVHTAQKPYHCEICNKGFSQYQDLTRHKHVHTGLTPYVCEICGKGFKQKYSMDIHKCTHTGHKPFICQYCNKGFSQNDSLTRHKRVHTGEAPYVCNVCNLAFRRSDTLVKHKRRTHATPV